MKCLKCQFRNPEGLTFCSKGSFRNLPRFKFCGECGHDLNLSIEPPLRELSVDEKLHQVQRYLPTGLTEKIPSQKDKLEEKLKQVTRMCCAMPGFAHS
jgi:hypothetical protein